MLAMSLVSALLLPAAARADTTIGFDDLAVGTTVTNQYAAQGLRLGSSGDFGQSSPGIGDCGSPQVATRVITAYSSPNFAQLNTCAAPPGAVPRYAAGTYGALASAQGYVSVEVQATPATVSVGMTLNAYSATGALVASGTASAASGVWTLLKVAQAGGAAAITYFEITSAASTNSSLGVAVDDLAFGAGSTTSGNGGSGGGGGGGSGSAPTAVIEVTTPVPTAGQPVALSGAGSDSGKPTDRIVSYDWDFNGDGKTDTSTGTDPNASFVFTPGRHVVGLTVTTSNGQQSKTTFPVTVTQTNLKAPPKADGGSGPCQSSVAIEDVTVLGDCIQTDPSGGYVISSATLSLNGTIFATRSADQEIFHIKQFNHLGIDYGWQLSGAAVTVELPNTPVGTVVLGGVDLSSNPINLADHAFVPPKLSLGNLNAQLRADHRLVTPDGRPVARPAGGNSKVLLFQFAAGQQCEKGAKGATCCPSGAGVSCAQLPGNFPIGGQVAVYTNTSGQLLIDVQVDVQVPDFQATGALEIQTSLQSGINLNSLQFTIPKAGLAQVFQVSDAEFTYYFPSYPDASKADSWQAKATLTFGPLSQPSIAGELDFVKGQFHYASATINLPEPGIQVYAGVFLTEFGAGVGVNPTQVSGTIGAGWGGSDGVAIELSFKYADSTSTTLGFFGGQGTVKLGGQQIAQLQGDVYSDGYVDAALQVGIKEPQDSPVIQVLGKASFWDEPSDGLWQLTGSLDFNVWILDLQVDALANNNWLAGCGSVQIGPFSVGAYAAWNFPGSYLDYGTTGNCTNQFTGYQETPTTPHSGGYVGSVRGRAPRARLGESAGTRVLASAADYGTIKIPSGKLAEELRISSASGTPVVRITGPGGVNFTTPTQAGTATGSNRHYVAVLAPVPHQVVVLLEHPAGGTYAIQPVAGSPPVTNVQNSIQVGPAHVRVSVKPGHHGHYALTYHVTNLLSGSRVQFAERGRDSGSTIGTTRHASGAINFTPQDALGRRRTIYATFLNSKGAAVRTAEVGHYTAPPAARGGDIRAARFVRSAADDAVISWTAAHGAKEYRVLVRGSDGRRVDAVVSAKTRRLVLSGVLPTYSFAATVTAIGGPNLLPGPARRVSLGRAAGPVELLTCNRGRCSEQLVTGVLTVKSTEIAAQLIRGGHRYGTGISADTTGRRLSLRVAHSLPRGRYTLELSRGRGPKARHTQGTVIIT